MIFFVVNDTASSEINTYLHPLSLHDAIPSSARVFVGEIGADPAFGQQRGRCGVEVAAGDGRAIALFDEAIHQLVGERARGRRSEEHTSELQSLMRSSYAVFCLTKQNTI